MQSNKLKKGLTLAIPTSLGISGLVGIILLSVSTINNNMADNLQDNSTSFLDDFKGWPVTSMFEFLVIHDSVIHAYHTADTEKTFDIDKNKALGVSRDGFRMYFNADSVERTPTMEQVGNRLRLRLNLDQYNAVREYFNKVVPP